MRLRFRLRTLLIGMLVLGVVLGVGASMARRAQKQARFCELVRAGGGYVRFLGYPAEVDGRILWTGQKRDEGLLNRLLGPWLGPDGWGTLNLVAVGPGTNPEAGLQILSEAAAYPSLQTVALWGQEITPAVVERISDLPRLRVLFLSGGWNRESALARLNADRLERLVIRGFDTRHWDWNFLSRLPRLLALHIAESRVDIKVLTQKLRGRVLDSLELSHVQLFGDLSGLAELSSAALEIRGAPVNDRDLRGISGNRYLRRLALQGTDVVYTITDELMLLPLESLDLSDTAITDATVEKLARVETLSEFRLAGTRITDAGLLELRKLQNLRNLSVSIGNGVTTVGLKRLSAELPACEIEYTDATGSVNGIPAAGRK